LKDKHWDQKKLLIVFFLSTYIKYFECENESKHKTESKPYDRLGKNVSNIAIEKYKEY
jgi:hypothetical protein